LRDGGGGLLADVEFLSILKAPPALGKVAVAYHDGRDPSYAGPVIGPLAIAPLTLTTGRVTAEKNSIKPPM